MDVTQGPAGRQWGQGSFPSELRPRETQGTGGCPLPAAARVPGKRQREAPVEGPLGGVGCCGVLGSPPHPAPGQASRACGGRGKSPRFLRRPGEEQEWHGQPFCSSHAGWWSWHFRPKAPTSLGGLWLSPRHRAGGLLPAPRQGQGWEIQQGASACPKDELPWQPPVLAQWPVHATAVLCSPRSCGEGSAQPGSTFRRVSEQAGSASRGSRCDAEAPLRGTERAPLLACLALQVAGRRQS